jgi:transposase
MDKKRRYYAPEFKREAVQLAIRSGRPMAVVERELGITAGLLRKWRRDMLSEGEAAFPGKGNRRANEMRLRELERENVRLREERDILKKVLALYSKEGG